MRLDSCVRGSLLIGQLQWGLKFDQSDGYVLFTVQTYQIRTCTLNAAHNNNNNNTKKSEVECNSSSETVINTNCHRILAQSFHLELGSGS